MQKSKTDLHKLLRLMYKRAGGKRDLHVCVFVPPRQRRSTCRLQLQQTHRKQQNSSAQHTDSSHFAHFSHFLIIIYHRSCMHLYTFTHTPQCRGVATRDYNTSGLQYSYPVERARRLILQLQQSRRNSRTAVNVI